jgi:hypothetical protein
MKESCRVGYLSLRELYEENLEGEFLTGDPEGYAK